jgi:large subunit ribosomal protein L21
VGRPLVDNASVAADVVRQVRGEKVISFKYRPKARRRVTKGHRQELTLLRISDIVFDGRSAAADARMAEEAARSERQRVEEAARRQAAADAELAARLAANAPTKSAGTGSRRGPAKPAGRAAGKSGAGADQKPESGAAPKTRPGATRSPQSGSVGSPSTSTGGKATRTPRQPRTRKDGEA